MTKTKALVRLLASTVVTPPLRTALALPVLAAGHCRWTPAKASLSGQHRRLALRGSNYPPQDDQRIEL
jgi:hypothetical protein